MISNRAAFRSATRLSCGFVTALVFAAGGQSAQAALVGIEENATISNNFYYRVGDQEVVIDDAGPEGKIFANSTAPDDLAEVGIDYTATLDNGSFYFLHNAYCVGRCDVGIETSIVFTLTNTGDTAQDIRFDSLITPGHLARIGVNGRPDDPGDLLTRFQFDVTQNLNGMDTTLYSAKGDSQRLDPNITTSDGSTFNGLNTTNNDPNWGVTDWSATNLNIDLLTLGAGETTTLTYHSTVFIGASFLPPDFRCTDLADCMGFQIVFGDPRNIGGGTNNNATAFGSADATTGRSAINRQFDPYSVSYNFAEQGPYTPPEQKVLGPIAYDSRFDSYFAGAVPEPSTWALLLLGFGAIGGMMRRPRAGVVTACHAAI